MLNNDFQKLAIDGIITLYQLDATALGAGILYLHGHTNYEDWVKIYSSIGKASEFVGDTTKLVGFDYSASDTNKELRRDIIFNGITYKPVAIDSDGLEQRGDGKLVALPYL